MRCYICDQHDAELRKPDHKPICDECYDIIVDTLHEFEDEEEDGDTPEL